VSELRERVQNLTVTRGCGNVWKVPREKGIERESVADEPQFKKRGMNNEYALLPADVMNT